MAVASAPMPTIVANGLDIAYEVDRRRSAAGHAPRRDERGPRALRRAPVRSLAERHSASILPDARGHGRTRVGRGRRLRRPIWLVDDLEAFADALGLATFHLRRLLDGRR